MEEIRSDEVSFQKVSDSSRDSIDEHLIGKALDFKDWLPQIDELNRGNIRDQSSLAGVGLRPYSSNQYSLNLLRLARRLISRITGKSTLQIENILNFSFEDDSFWGGNLDSLQIGDRFINSSSIPISGWIAGRNNRVIAVRLVLNQEFLVDIPLSVSRPDVRNAYLFSDDYCYFGYSSEIVIPKKTWRAELKIHAVFEDSNISSSISLINLIVC